MIGRFLEVSVATADIAASFDFYTRLGFAQLAAGDAWPHAYAVVGDGRIHIGLHAADLDSPQLTFVRPQLLKATDALERLGIACDVRRLGNDAFNELGWPGPGGQRIRLVEARTFSPVQANTAASLCGHFLEIALPAADVEGARHGWERMGFIGLDETDGPLPHVCCISDALNIGLYPSPDIPEPTLVFEADDVPALRARLAGLGIEPARRAPRGLGAADALLLKAPEGTALLVYSATPG
jgi:catechol 2,3-dioxygenase-like lactoylglutathione lyase family enzyme